MLAIAWGQLVGVRLQTPRNTSVSRTIPIASAAQASSVRRAVAHTSSRSGAKVRNALRSVRAATRI